MYEQAGCGSSSRSTRRSHYSPTAPLFAAQSSSSGSSAGARPDPGRLASSCRRAPSPSSPDLAGAHLPPFGRGLRIPSSRQARPLMSRRIPLMSLSKPTHEPVHPTHEPVASHLASPSHPTLRARRIPLMSPSHPTHEPVAPPPRDPFEALGASASSCRPGRRPGRRLVAAERLHLRRGAGAALRRDAAATPLRSRTPPRASSSSTSRSPTWRCRRSMRAARWRLAFAGAPRAAAPTSPTRSTRRARVRRREPEPEAEVHLGG